MEKRILSFTFETQKPKINSSLRGISVIDSLTACASGSNGTYLRTTDGGKSWTDGKVKGFETLDFRDIEAFDKNTAIIMSIDAPHSSLKLQMRQIVEKKIYEQRSQSIL